MLLSSRRGFYEGSRAIRGCCMARRLDEVRYNRRKCYSSGWCEALFSLTDQINPASQPASRLTSEAGNVGAGREKISRPFVQPPRSTSSSTSLPTLATLSLLVPSGEVGLFETSIFVQSDLSTLALAPRGFRTLAPRIARKLGFWRCCSIVAAGTCNPTCDRSERQA